MNLGTIAKSNSKGQLVIPKKIRDKLGINTDMLLNITLRGDGIFIRPLEKSLETSDSRKISLELLKKTAGAWKDDDWQATEKKRREIELNSAKARRNAW